MSEPIRPSFTKQRNALVILSEAKDLALSMSEQMRPSFTKQQNAPVIQGLPFRRRILPYRENIRSEILRLKYRLRMTGLFGFGSNQRAAQDDCSTNRTNATDPTSAIVIGLNKR